MLRCTRELLARVTQTAAEPAATSTTRLGDWYVALVRVGPRQTLLAISERTRLPVLVPARDARGTADPLAGAVGRLLLGIGVPEVDVATEVDAMADAVFPPTRNRSLLGTLDDFTFAIQHRQRREPTSLDETISPAPIAAPSCSPDRLPCSWVVSRSPSPMWSSAAALSFRSRRRGTAATRRRRS